MFAPRFARSTTVRYGPSRIQTGELSVAAAGSGSGPRPIVVFLHGGFWRWPYGRWLMRRLVTDTNRRGWHAYNVSYRRLGRLGGGGGWPETFDDVASAVEMLADRAPSIEALHDWDGRIAVVGHSAGGHLALTCAARVSAPIVGVISAGGPTDLESLAAGHPGGVVDRLVANAPAHDRWSLTSPLEMVPIGTPMRLIHGALDSSVPLEMVQRFADRAAAAGDDVTLSVVATEGHRDVLRNDSESWRLAAHQLDAWFDPNP